MMFAKCLWQLTHVVLTVDIVTSALVGLAGKRLKIDVCDFGDRQYSVGDTWHPHLRPHGTNYCIKCSCFSFGQVRCSNTECPVLTCAKPRHVPDKCCPQCLDSPLNPLDELATRPPTYQNCLYQNKEYVHGELFTTDDIFLTRRKDQCVQCSCSEGNVYCALKTCLPTPCHNPVVLPDSCCPICNPQDIDETLVNNGQLGTNSNAVEQTQPGNRPSTHPNLPVAGLPFDGGLLPRPGPLPGGEPDNTASLQLGSDLDEGINEGKTGNIPSTHPNLAGLPFNDSLLPRPGRGPLSGGELEEGINGVCDSNGDIYYEGQTWHPTLFPFGVMKCILCTCRSGIADCGRVECPSVNSLPCANPIQIHGQCCKICPESVKPSRPDDLGQSSDLFPDSAQDMATPTPSLCLRRNEDILVYKYRITSDEDLRNEDSFEYAIEKLETEEVELHVWRLSEGAIEDFQIGTISRESFSRLQEHDRYGRYHLVGASTTNRLRKLKRKEQKIQQSCTSNCYKRISRLMKPLKVRELAPSIDCRSTIETTKQKLDSRLL